MTPRDRCVFDVYLAGPITPRNADGPLPAEDRHYRDILAYHLESFRCEAARLRALGWRVFCPVEGEPLGLAWIDYMRRDFGFFAQCWGVAFLPGWSTSRGALIEAYLAERLDMPVFEAAAIRCRPDDMEVR